MRKNSTLIVVGLSTVLAAGLLVYLVVRPSSPPTTTPADPTGAVTSRPVPTDVAGGSPRPIPSDVGLSAPLPLG